MAPQILDLLFDLSQTVATIDKEIAKLRSDLAALLLKDRPLVLAALSNAHESFHAIASESFCGSVVTAARLSDMIRHGEN